MVVNVDVKKERQPAAGGSIIRQGFEYIEEIKGEFRRVNWTNAEELQTYTKIVVGGAFAFGMMVYVADLFIKLSLEAINFILRAITG